MPHWHNDEETHLHVNEDIPKPLQLEGKTCLVGIHCDKDHPLLEL